jgi:hypothetical protein
MCHICDRGFKYSTDLGRHLNTHNNNNKDNNTTASTSTKQVNGHQQRVKLGVVASSLIRKPFVQRGLKAGFNQIDTRPFQCKICKCVNIYNIQIFTIIIFK